MRTQSRRHFIRCTAISAGLCCPLLTTCSKKEEVVEQEGIDYSKFSYCGLECNACDLFKATQANDVQEKKRLAKEWFDIEEKDFKAEIFFCHTCKVEDKPHNQFQQTCNVRACAKEKALLTCAHCDELPNCDKEFWTKWPQVKEKIDGMRQELLDAQKA